ncbi:helix-turn-helix domain-containing protein [Dehalobacter sp. DCM]|uniref:PucR family transcriptional regulator n=1 Tax=Dehalobacter sp. DCM TaxID=2907827 RepID=UPI00308150C3|nr:helix-turn-helix domain-containing protein [Dehalobacter sp. DCM]
MNISIQMIAERIQQYNPTLNNTENCSYTLKSLKYLKKDQSQFDAFHVYLAESSDIDKNHPILQQEANLIYYGNQLSKDLLDNSPCYIIQIEPRFEFHDIYNDISSIFDLFNNWENELQESIINQRGLQDLIDIAFKIFQNPIYLLDTHLITLAWSKEIGEDEVDYAWKCIVKEGHADMRVINSLINSGTLKFLFDNRKASFVIRPKEFRYKGIEMNIRIDHQTVAHLGILEIRKPFADSDLYLTEQLAKYIAVSIKTDPHYQKTQGPLFERFITDLLGNTACDQRIIQHYLNYLGWQPTDPYCLLIAVPNQDALLANALGYYCSYLKKLFVGINTIIYDNNLIVIINLRINMNFQDTAIEKLKEFFKQNNFECGLSTSFYDFSLLSKFYSESTAALELGKIIDPDELFYSYRDYAVYLIIQSSYKQVDLLKLCHRGLIKLLSYDHKNHTDFYKCLHVYLTNNKSLVESAKELGIHRNTFVYRIDKIMHIINFDLKNNKEVLHIMFSYLVIEYVEKTSSLAKVLSYLD